MKLFLRFRNEQGINWTTDAGFLLVFKAFQQAHSKLRNCWNNTENGQKDKSVVQVISCSFLSTGLFVLSAIEVMADSVSFELSRSVVKIMALSGNGKQNMGSGVVIGKNKIATNCHVTRNAKKAYSIKEGKHLPVIAQAALPELDVCILKTELLVLPVVTLANSSKIKIEDEITIYSYPFALGLRMMQGKVNGLHEFKQDRIIEINASFTHGASGGAVFNKNGELAGLITFMGKHKEQIHFYAVPSSWLAKGLKARFVPMKVFTTQSFWEKGEFDHQTLQ